MSDAAVDVFAEAFEDDPIQRAVAAAMMQLAAQVRVLNQSADPDFHDTVSRAGILALIEVFRYRISRKAVAHIVSSYRSDLADEVRGLPDIGCSDSIDDGFGPADLIRHYRSTDVLALIEKATP